MAEVNMVRLVIVEAAVDIARKKAVDTMEADTVSLNMVVDTSEAATDSNMEVATKDPVENIVLSLIIALRRQQNKLSKVNVIR